MRPVPTCAGKVHVTRYGISRRDVINDSIGNRVSNVVVTMCGDRWLLDLRSDHFVRYVNIESLSYTSETNVILYVNYN